MLYVFICAVQQVMFKVIWEWQYIETKFENNVQYNLCYIFDDPWQSLHRLTHLICGCIFLCFENWILCCLFMQSLIRI